MGTICLVRLLISRAAAQNITGTITGVVDDPAGAKIVGATVTALNKIPARGGGRRSGPRSSSSS